MKTAVSIPDQLHAAADELAARLNLSRSRLYSLALDEYLARHAGDSVTEAVNRVVDEVGGEVDAFGAAAASRTLRSVEW